MTAKPGPDHTIVFLHGFLASKKYWSKVLPLISRNGYRVAAIDLLGFGRAPKPKDVNYDYADHLKHVDLSVAHLLSDGQKLTLVGHSMGALIAARWASRNPSKVKAVILVNPPIYKDRHEARMTLRSTGRLYRFLLDSKYRHCLWVILRTIGVLSRHTKHSRERSLRNIIESADLLGDVANLEIPTVILTGKKDRAQYLKNLEDKVFNDNVKVIYEDVAHHAPRTDADLVSKIILEAISG